MKKIVLILTSILLIVGLAGCSSAKSNSDGPYSMNASISYGGVEKDNLYKTKVSYDIIISGEKNDIENIDAEQLIINPECIDLLSERGPHTNQIKREKKPYMKIKGSLIFNTEGKSKEEIDAMKLLIGVELIDKNGNKHMLTFFNE